MERLQGIEGVKPTAYTTGYTYHKMKRIVREFVKDSLRPGARVLDVGCGRGHDLLRLAEEFRPLNLQLYGVEVSRQDLRVAIKRASSLLVPVSAGFLLSVAERMPFRSDSFDAVMCSEVVEHLPDPDAALREVWRVLKSGGVLALTTPNAGNKLHKLRKFLPRGLKAKTDGWREMQHDIDRERRTAQGVNLPHVSELSAGEWCDRLRRAGFEPVEVRRGSLLYGDPYLEERPALWALSVLMDRFLDRVSDDWSWQVLIKARKAGGTGGESR